jgi:hypothetical protein
VLEIRLGDDHAPLVFFGSEFATVSTRGRLRP